jgi:hypothetical protein
MGVISARTRMSTWTTEKRFSDDPQEAVTPLCPYCAVSIPFSSTPIREFFRELVAFRSFSKGGCTRTCARQASESAFGGHEELVCGLVQSLAVSQTTRLQVTPRGTREEAMMPAFDSS